MELSGFTYGSIFQSGPCRQFLQRAARVRFGNWHGHAVLQIFNKSVENLSWEAFAAGLAYGSRRGLTRRRRLGLGIARVGFGNLHGHGLLQIFNKSVEILSWGAFADGPRSLV